MSTPPSLANSPFTKLGDFNKPIDDDYTLKNLETIKFKATTKQGAVVKAKAKFDLVQKEGNVSGKFDDESSWQFPVNNNWVLWLGSRRKNGGEIKYHLDFGTVELAGKKFSLFANCKADNSFDKRQFRFGSVYQGSKCDSGNRIEFANGRFSWTNRTVVRHSNFLFGFATNLSLDTFTLGKYDAVAGLEESKFRVYVQHKSACCGKTSCTPKLGSVAVSGAFDADKDTTVGVYAEKPAKGKEIIQAGAVRKLCKDTSVRAKFDNNLELSLGAKHKFCNLLTATVSAKHNFNQTPDFTKFPLPIGFQFDLNI